MPLDKKVIFLYCNVPLDVKMNNAKLPLLFSNNLESILLCFWQLFYQYILV